MSVCHKNLYLFNWHGPHPRMAQTIQEVVSPESTPFLGNFPIAAGLQKQCGSVLLPYRWLGGLRCDHLPCIEIPESPWCSWDRMPKGCTLSAVPDLCVSVSTSASPKSQILRSLGLNLIILLPLLQGNISPRPRRKRDVLETCEEQCLGWFNIFERISSAATIKRAN